MFKIFSGMVIASVPLLSWACCPDFPPSFFNGDDAPELQRNLIGELSLIGKHFYPQWTDHKIVHNSIKTDSAHRLDFFAAGKTHGFSDSDCQKAFEDYQVFDQACKDTAFAFPDHTDRIRSVPQCFKEFYLYSWGLCVYKARPNRWVSPWFDLMGLEPSYRRYRTLWVVFAEALYFNNNYQAIDRKLSEFQKLRKEGFADTPGLESSLLRQLVRRGDKVLAMRYLPLFLAANQADTPYVQSVKNDFLPLSGDYFKNPSHFDALLTDPAGREVLLVTDPGRILKMDVGTLFGGGSGALMSADRLAWFAFKEGDIQKARGFLNLSSKESLLTLFVKARLARLDGDFKAAAAHLREWLKRYDAQRPQMPDVGVSKYERYDVSVPEAMSGQLGFVLFEQDDFVEALYAFMKASAWEDAAVVAETRVQTDSLIDFVEHHGKLKNISSLRYLLARRLMREYRVLEAEDYFPEAHKASYETYVKLSQCANDSERSGDERAVAFFNLASLCRDTGMALFGTELYPDYSVYDGVYGFPEPASGKGLTREQERFHYRTRAADFALRGAMIAEDGYVRAGLLFLGASCYKKRNRKGEELFFKMLYDMPEKISGKILHRKGYFSSGMYEKASGTGGGLSRDEIIGFAKECAQTGDVPSPANE